MESRLISCAAVSYHGGFAMSNRETCMLQFWHLGAAPGQPAFEEARRWKWTAQRTSQSTRWYMPTEPEVTDAAKRRGFGLPLTRQQIK